MQFDPPLSFWDNRVMNSTLRSFVGAFVLVLLAFLAGVQVGAHGVNPIDTVMGIEHKEPQLATTTADFAPFWKAWTALNEKWAVTKSSSTPPTDQEKVWGAIQGLAASYGDPYTVFFPPQQSKSFNEAVKGEFGGVGMEVAIKDDILTVVSPLKDTPSYKAGLKAGDRIIKIDGHNTSEMTIETAVSKMHGDVGTKVVLTINRESEKKIFDVEIVRAVIKIPTIETEMKDGVFIIKFYSFTAESPQLFKNAILEFSKQQTDKMIIDLRGNPGGYLESAVEVASFFLPEGQVIVRESGNRARSEDKLYRSNGYNVFNNLKLVILVNGGSASASEILAGALHEHGKAKLVGEKTFGKGSVQELIPITDDTSLKVTIARWLTPNGLSISDGGITPDYVVKLTEDDFKAKRDPQLDKAFEVLKNW